MESWRYWTAHQQNLVMLREVNIFACDEWAVYSSRKVDVVPGFLQSAVVDSDLKCDVGGEFGAWALLKLKNTVLFILFELH